jgi:hypothetical protein
MKHLKEALSQHGGTDLDYIKVANNNVVFTIQDGPIGEVGLNGVQALDMLIFNKNLFESLNRAYPCQENQDTINSLNKAIKHQHDRTKNREARGVEGLSKA